MFYPELKGTALAAYNDMVDKLIANAMSELGLGPDEIIVRPLKPQDLGETYDVWYEEAASTAWDTYINAQTVDSNRWIGINGIYNGEGEAELTQVHIKREGSDARFWQVNHIKNWPSKIGYVDDPVTLDQDTSVTIKFYARTASTLHDFALIGAVAEKRGMTINP